MGCSSRQHNSHWKQSLNQTLELFFPGLPPWEGGGISNHSNKEQRPHQLAVVSSLRGSRRTAHLLFMKNEASGGLCKKPGSKYFSGAVSGKLASVQNIRRRRGGGEWKRETSFPKDLPAIVGRRITKGKLSHECFFMVTQCSREQTGLVSCSESLHGRKNTCCRVGVDAHGMGSHQGLVWRG